jgi:hypothetical protein
MGRSVTPKFRVEYKTNDGREAVMCWNDPLHADAETLEHWRVTMNKSFQPGGVNGHLSTKAVLHITSARLVHQKTGKTVATATMPMFEVV